MTTFLLATISLSIGWILGAIAERRRVAASRSDFDVSAATRSIAERILPGRAAVTTTLVTPDGATARVDPKRAEALLERLIGWAGERAGARVAAVVEALGDRVVVTIAHDGTTRTSDAHLARAMAGSMGGEFSLAPLRPQGVCYRVSFPAA